MPTLYCLGNIGKFYLRQCVYNPFGPWNQCLRRLGYLKACALFSVYEYNRYLRMRVS